MSNSLVLSPTTPSEQKAIEQCEGQLQLSIALLFELLQVSSFLEFVEAGFDLGY